MLSGIIPGLGGGELIALLFLGVLLFGRKLPDVGRQIGGAITGIRNGINGVEDSPREPRPGREPEPMQVPNRVTPPARPAFDDVPAAPVVSVPPIV